MTLPPKGPAESGLEVSVGVLFSLKKKYVHVYVMIKCRCCGFLGSGVRGGCKLPNMGVED